MKPFNHQAFEQARLFLLTKARPLEQAQFKHHFEGANVESVLAELARFQNADGGFGRALEPDLRTPSSSALATGIALALLVDLDCSPENPLVQRSVTYLLETFNEETHIWRVAAANTNSYPHAPWWHDADGSLARTFDNFRIIPRVLILSSLWHYASLIQTGWLHDLTEEVVGYVEFADVLGEGGGSDLEYVIRLAQARNLPGSFAERLKARIHEALPGVVEHDPAKWHTYCITPLRAVPSPDSIGADLIPAAIQAHLDYQIERQEPDGAWDPTWTWGGSYPEVWEQVRQEWRGLLTLEALTSLHAFGRIAV